MHYHKFHLVDQTLPLNVQILFNLTLLPKVMKKIKSYFFAVKKQCKKN